MVGWHRLILGICGLILCAGFATGAEAPAPWPQWRGPHRDGQVLGPAWPDSLQGERLKPLWRVKLGPGYSGPLVAADRVFVTETRGNTREVVLALRRDTGDKLWEASWKGSISVPFFAKSNGDWIRSTRTAAAD